MTETATLEGAGRQGRLYMPVPRPNTWVLPGRGPTRPASEYVGCFAARLSSLALDLTTTDSPGPSEVRRRLRQLAGGSAASGIEESRTVLEATSGSHSRATSNRAMEEALGGDLPASTIDRYLDYDRYFGVVRVPLMTEQALLAQVLLVGQRLLEDLPHAFLARDEVTSLLVGLAIMISGEATPDAGRPDAAEAMVAATGEASTPADPLARWILGHHVYFLATAYCRRFLERGLDPAAGRQAQAEWIGLAASLLRTTTAAMWYASELSPDAYLNCVRPSMPSDGFSGEHSADHIALRACKERLIHAATAMSKAPQGPSDYEVLYNMERFFEIDIENTEAHVLLAASKVGREASLAQHAAVDDDELPQTTAVDMLRAIGKHKQSVTAAFLRSQLRRRGHLHAGSGRAIT